LYNEQGCEDRTIAHLSGSWAYFKGLMMAGEELSRFGVDPGLEERRSDLEAAAAEPPGSGRGNPPASASPVPISRRLILLTSFWAGLAGIIAWWVGESQILDAPARPERFVVAGVPIVWSTPATTEAAARVTSSRLHAVFGGLLGLALGWVSGWARSSTGAALTAGLVGAGVGALVGGGTPYLVLPFYAQYRQIHGGDLAASLVLHVSLWAGIGAAAGLALGLGVGGSLRALKAACGGFLGALCGALIFDFLGALAFPLEETGLPTSSTARTRLLARILVAVMTALGATIAAGPIPARSGKKGGDGEKGHC
jgi:hypothetical protein